MERRDFLKMIGGLSVTGLTSNVFAKEIMSNKTKAKVVIVGGGFGGTTVAKYLNKWFEGKLDITLITKDVKFKTCPMSNLALVDKFNLKDLEHSYADLKNISIVHDFVLNVIAEKKLLLLKNGTPVKYDYLVLSPGIEFDYEGIDNSELIIHSWQAGPQTEQLKNKILNIKNGDNFILSIPKMPYRCPPGPYERACLVANYFKENNIKSKVLIFDANDDVMSKTKLFKKAFKDKYSNHIEYIPMSKLDYYDTKRNEISFNGSKFGNGNVINFIPKQRAAKLISETGLSLSDNGWTNINWPTMESSIENIFVLGDSIVSPSEMPKSGHLANQQGKLVAYSIISKILNQEIDKKILIMNTCYSFVDYENVIHASTIHIYNEKEKTMEKKFAAGGLSKEANKEEVEVASYWYKNIINDTFKS